jgi:RNA polymerase sigma-70 factor (ECF subfamily)
MKDSNGFPRREPADHPIYQSALHGNDWGRFATDLEPLRPKLVRCIGLMTADWDEAESIVQETFQRAGVQRQELADGSPIYPWLRAIAVNLSKQFLDRRARHAKPMDWQDTEPTENRLHAPRAGVLTEILRDELATKVWLAIGQLPQAYREAVVLHYVDRMNYPEISALTGVPAGALRARAMRARQLLRGNLGSVVDTWMRTTRHDNDGS